MNPNHQFSIMVLDDKASWVIKKRSMKKICLFFTSSYAPQFRLTHCTDTGQQHKLVQDNLHRRHILLVGVLVMVIIWATLSVVYTKWHESYHVELLDNPKNFHVIRLIRKPGQI